MSYLMIGLAGASLTAQERQWLARPEVGGLTLFARNIDSIGELEALIGDIRSIDPEAFIAIDQEGGRVQRIKAPCTVLPPLLALGDGYRADEDTGLEQTYTHAWLMASEMRALGIDQSFAPVLDLDCGSDVIGDRAFGADPIQVKELARAYIKGLHAAGMAAVGKHFPGHGSIVSDTHFSDAVDDRSFSDIAISDLRPFTVAISHGLDAVMMAHVCYPQVCEQPAGYSEVWIKQILRERIGFDGVVFSDDLGMAAAASAGNYQQRLDAAIAAGSDFVLVCASEDVTNLFNQVENWPPLPSHDPRQRLRRYGDIPQPGWQEFANSQQRLDAQQIVSSLTNG